MRATTAPPAAPDNAWQRQGGPDLGAHLARATSSNIDDMAFWSEEQWLAEFLHATEDGQLYIDTGRRASGLAHTR